MQTQRTITPTVYVESANAGRNPQTIVKVVWNENRVEEQSFATLAEALQFAQSFCTREDQDLTTV